MFDNIKATVLFVRDLDKCMTFYRDIVGFQMDQSDAQSAGFALENQYFILLHVSAAAQMISEEPLELKFEGGPRGLMAAAVEDVDAAYEELKTKGVTVLRPPTDQPWGLRTAYFTDPEGNLWEINQPVKTQTE
jgi:lactoylglutathione lyase